MNQENVTNVNEEVVNENKEDKAVVDWGFDEDKAQELAEEINKKIEQEKQDKEDSVRRTLNKAFGVNEKIYEINENFYEFFTDVMEIVEKGNPEQRKEGLCIIETLERLGIIKAGVSLGVKDVFTTFNKKHFAIQEDKKKKAKVRKDKAFTVGMPKAGLTKEEFDKDIEQQIRSQYAEVPQEVVDATIVSAWSMYERISKETENLSTDENK